MQTTFQRQATLGFCPPSVARQQHGHQFGRRYQRQTTLRCLGSEGVQSFMDMAAFLSRKTKGNFAELQDEIGREIYVDLNGFHLYLRDLRAVPGSDVAMAQVVSDSLGAKLVTGFNESSLKDGLRIIPLRMGGGKQLVALMDAMPERCVQDLMEICERYHRQNY